MLIFIYYRQSFTEENVITIQNKFEDFDERSEAFKLYLSEALNEICVKLTFNCLSTGSFVLKGKVYF